MVVMAIIAILAIAGLAAYVGYIKQARDTARISDLATINKALLAVTTNDGKSPQSIPDVITAIKAVNSGVLIKDPTGTDTCLNAGGSSSNQKCGYYYRQCDNGSGFVVSARLESKANASKYTKDGIEALENFEGATKSDVDSYWSLGACTTLCSGSASGDCQVVDHTLITPPTP